MSISIFKHKAPSATAQKPASDQQKEAKKEGYTLKELLDGEGPGFTGIMAISVFRDSPLQSSRMEASVLGMILVDAHTRKVPLSEAYVGVESGTGADYINSFATMEGKTYQNLFRYDPSNPKRIYVGETLAAFMTERLNKFGYSPTGTVTA